MRIPQPILRRNGKKMVTVRVNYHLDKGDLINAIQKMVLFYGCPFPTTKSAAFTLVKTAVMRWGENLTIDHDELSSVEESDYLGNQTKIEELFSDMD